MQHIPEIAIVEQNTLTALGLQTIPGRAYPRSDHPYVSVVRQD